MGFFFYFFGEVGSEMFFSVFRFLVFCVCRRLLCENLVVRSGVRVLLGRRSVFGVFF